MEKPNMKMIAVACERLGIDEREAAKSYRAVPNLEGAGFFVPHGRGSGRLLVSAFGETLWASSALAPSKHVEAFRRGLRN